MNSTNDPVDVRLQYPKVVESEEEEAEEEEKKH